MVIARKTTINFLIVLVMYQFMPMTTPKASTEIIQYGYDDSQQIREMTYNDGTNVHYIYDTSGNRISKDILLPGTPSNNSPAEPIYGSPADAAEGIRLPVSLSWAAGTDPDAGDRVTYDIYFGTSVDPPLIANGYQSTIYPLADLKAETDYYWKVIARDNHNATSPEGPVWTFRTSVDSDGDGIGDDGDGNGTPGDHPCTGGNTTSCDDSCPYTVNPDQADMDADGKGDACDLDIDGDGVNNDTPDNCRTVPNPGQLDTDQDGYGDDCDSDIDGDGIDNDVPDNCPALYNPDQSDMDGDALGDICDDDMDGDAVLNDADNCMSEKNPRVTTWRDIDNNLHNYNTQPDYDLDGTGDPCDTDLDNDGIDNLEDNCPVTRNGPLAGTCIEGSDAGSRCTSDQECSGGYCSLNQEDTKGDGHGDACTHYECAGDSEHLQQALDSVTSTPEDDVIQLTEEGTFIVSSKFTFSSSYGNANHNIKIQGGYNGDCSSRVSNTSSTMIDGNSLNAFSIYDQYSLDLPHWFVLEGVTIQNSSQAILVNTSKEDVTIKNTVITGNTSSSSGSGINIFNNKGNAVISNNVVNNNSASQMSGIRVSNQSGRVILSNNIIKDNIATNGNGGGVYIYNDTGEVVLINNIVSNNEAKNFGGGTYTTVNGNGTVRLLNNTITGNGVTNPASGYGGGLYLRLNDTLSTIDLYNNIIWNNTAPVSGGDIHIVSSGGTVNAFNNDYDPARMSGAFTHEGYNVRNVDPLFGDAPGRDYHLSQVSQLINKGRNDVADMPKTDFEGNARIIGSLVDIGADEHGTEISGLPVSLYFGVIDVGNTSCKVVTVTNNGDQDLDISSITHPLMPFSIFTDTCSNRTLLPAGNCTIDVEFAPAASGLFTDNFEIPSSDPDGNPLGIHLDGTGNAVPAADSGGPYLGTEGEEIMLDASGSYDPDGTIVLYEWDIDNDGIFDYSSTSSTQAHTYTQDNVYTIKVRVTDDNDSTDNTMTAASISDTSPTADFQGAPVSGTEPLQVYFIDNSSGYDQPLRYEWDFTNDGTADSPDQNPSSIYNQGTFDVRLTVTDADGSTNTLMRYNYITVSPEVHTLTVGKTGSGTGSVNSLPVGIDCGMDCTEQYGAGTAVTLTAAEDGGSIFMGWSGAGCSGIGDCTVDVIEDITITAAFETCPVDAVRIDRATPVYFSTLQEAYDAAVDGDVIQSQEAAFIESLEINRDISVRLEGGYNCNYSLVTGQTIMNGNVTVNNGSVIMEDIIIE